MSENNLKINKPQTYLDIAGVIFMVLNKKGEITLINKKGCEVLEYKEDELLGKNWFLTCLPERIKEKVYKVFIKLIRGEIKATEFYENPIITKSGKEKFIAWHNTYLYDDEGKVSGTLSSGEDITEKKKAEIERQKLEKLKNDFLDRASHELKTPLVSIIGYAELLLHRYDSELDEEAKEYINYIQKACKRLIKLSNKLIKAQKLDTEILKLKISDVNITKLIKECVNAVYAYARMRNISISLDQQENLILKLDIERIQDVINNLILNALNYSPPGSVINIQSKREKDYILISIKDRGVGVSKEDQQKIFQKFGKIEHYGKNLDIAIEGVGMGLYISKKIVEIHNGRIWVESEGRNKGSTFYIKLPIK